jgi:hypothetical protein
MDQKRSARVTKDKAMAAELRRRNSEHPGSVPNSVVPGWRGHGWADRVEARKMHPGPVSNSRWELGMLGGALAWKCGATRIKPF